LLKRPPNFIEKYYILAELSVCLRTTGLQSYTLCSEKNTHSRFLS